MVRVDAVIACCLPDGKIASSTTDKARKVARVAIIVLGVRVDLFVCTDCLLVFVHAVGIAGKPDRNIPLTV